MPDLAGPRLKLQFAHDLLRDLAIEISDFSNSNAHSLDVEPVTGTNQKILRARTTLERDPGWGVRAGVFANLLRSALDNLAWQLALRSTDVPSRNTAFPIYVDADKAAENAFGKGGDDSKPARILTDIDNAERELLKQEQPYQDGNGGDQDPLWLLHQLNITDKHRVVPMAALLPVDFKFATPKGIPIGDKPMSVNDFISKIIPVHTGTAFVDGAELARVPADVEVTVKITVSVLFDDGCPHIKGKGVVDTLRSMYFRVKSILDKFESELAW